MNRSKYSIRVDLKKMRLFVTDTSGRPAAEYPVIIGRNSRLGTKTAEGDQRTPRGTYRICTINRQSRFTLFLGLSYPGPDDARAGFERGDITREQQDEILEAYRERRRPPWDTPLGGQVGIHGGGIDRDGTRGCVAMRDSDVLELDGYAVLGTIVEIFNPDGTGDVL